MFRNLRFSAASASITFVYFSLMGVMYFMTTYMQTVLGFSALEAGERMLPIAGGMLLTARPAVTLTKRLGTKAVVAAGLSPSPPRSRRGGLRHRHRHCTCRLVLGADGRRHGARDGAGHRGDHGLAAARPRPASARR